MLGCTLKEFADRFDENLTNYLEAYEDNTLISFLDNQIEIYFIYQFEILKISNELIINGEKKATEVFLKSSTYDGLKKIDFNTYQNILLEEKKIEPNDNFFNSRDIYENKYTNLKVRIDLNKLKNHISSAEKILEFIRGKYQIFEHEAQLIINQALSRQDDPSFIETTNSADFEPIELEIEDRADPDKSKKKIIDKYLKPYSKYLLEDDYNALTNSFLAYFATGNFPKLEKKIEFKHLDKKCIGWALKEIYKSFTTEKLDIELFRFAQQNINLFKKEVIDEKKFYKSSFYKSFTTNPKSYKY